MSSAQSISSNFFGLTIQAYNYDFSYEGGPVEAWPTTTTSVVRSWDVWSPGNSQIGYLDWADLNPSAGTYNWAPLNAWIAANEASGAQMVYTFGNVPSWAGSPTTPNLADFQAFVTAIVTEANGAIKYWEGLNEFNNTGISPTLLVQMQEIIYNTVHTLDPGALVLSPTVNSGGAAASFAQFLADGGGQYFDIAAFHGYLNSTGEGVAQSTIDIQNVLSEYGLSNKPLWDTEWGMEAPTVITNTIAQEAYVSTGLILQAALGVQTEIFYGYDNPNSALYNSATGQLTPAGVAYQETEQWLSGATLPSGYQLDGSVYTVQVVKNGQNNLLVWNSAGQSSFSAGSFAECVDAQGQVEPIVGGVVTIGTVPILLEDTELQTPPVVSSVVASGTGISNGNGDLNAGHVVTLTLTMSEAVTVNTTGGAPTLTLNDGGNATYTGGSGSNALIFSYTVAAGQNTPDLAVSAVNLNGATIADAAGNNASVSGTFSPTGTLQIDTTKPTVSSVTPAGIGISNGNGDLNAGHVVTLTLTMSEAVTVNTNGGAPTLTLNDGGSATYTGGSGSNVLTFSYTVAAGQNTSDLAVSSINLNGGMVTDQAGNSASLSGSFSLSGTLQIDTTPPTAPVIVSDAVNSNSTITVSGTANAGTTVSVYDGQTALGSTTATSNGTWSYTTGTVANGSQTLTATATDAAGNVSAVSNAVDPIVGNIPTVTSITASGSGITNGNGDLNAGHVVTLTLTMSEAVTVNTAGGTPTLTLNDGGTANYASSSGSTLTFSYTVAAGQNTPDLTVSTINLNGATIADAAGNNASVSGTFNPTGTVQIDTTSPKVSSVTASGSGISNGSGDLNAGHVVTLTLTMSEAVTINTAAGTPTLILNDGGTATYTGSSGSTLTFSYTVAAGQNTSDLTVSAVNLNGAIVADAAGNNASLAGTINPTDALQIDTTRPSPPVVSTDVINANNSITLTGTAEANTTVTVYDGTTVLGTTTASTGGMWSFTTGPLGSGAQVFTATATDAAGNTSTPSNSIDPTIGSPTASEIAAIYGAVLQRVPTDTELTASLAISSTLGSTGMVAAIADSAEAITNVYPILQMFDLAFGRFPSAATLASMVATGLTLPQLAAAIVGSQTFANTYNAGTLIDPNSSVTAGIVEALYNQALGHAPSQATLNGWLNSGLTVAQAFLEMVTSQSYAATAQPAIEQYLTTAAINNAGYPINSAAIDLTPAQIGAIYEAVLQRAPAATEVTASLALDSMTV